MADTGIGIRCSDCVILAAAGLNAFYYIKLSDTEDKITELSSHQMVACIGENGPRVNFTEYIKCNLTLNRMRQHGRMGSCHATANFMRNELASAIRSREGAYQVSCLLGGYDLPASSVDEGESGPSLFYMDYIGTLQGVPYAAHGYGASFVTALLDHLWRPDLTKQEGLELMQKCINEVKKRIVISNTYFVVKTASTQGIDEIKTIN